MKGWSLTGEAPVSSRLTPHRFIIDLWGLSQRRDGGILGQLMERVLVLMTTTTYKAAAFLEAARRLGLEVVVGSERPQALAGLNPAGHLTLDFADPEGAARTIAAAAPFATVVAADDEGAVLAATAGLSEAGLPTPWFEPISVQDDPAAIAARLRYPCVLKPLALSASRGVMRVDDPAGFVAAFRRLVALIARPDARPLDGAGSEGALVEGYLPGPEVAVEGLLTRGALRVLAIFDKPDPLEGPFFEETLYVTPSRLPAASLRAIEESTAAAARALGLSHGPVHAELRVNERGAWVLEIAPRSIGGLCSRALRFGDGASLEELILLHALGREIAGLEREPRSSGVMMIPIPRRGVLEEVRGLAAARGVAGVEEIRVTVPAGQPVEPPPEGSRYLGFIFARAGRAEEVEAALRAAHRELSIVIRPAGAPSPAGGRPAAVERT